MNYELAKKLKDAGFFQIYGSYPDGSDRMFYYNNCIIPFRALKEIKTNKGWEIDRQEVATMIPVLSELIEAVGFCFATLQQEHNDRTPEGYLKFSGWKALAVDADCGWIGKGLTPEIAVAELWLNIKNNVYKYSEPPIKGIKISDFNHQLADHMFKKPSICVNCHLELPFNYCGDIIMFEKDGFIKCGDCYKKYPKCNHYKGPDTLNSSNVCENC